MITASLKNYRQSPRKVRLVVDAIRGKKVTEALEILTFVNKKASNPVYKLIKSAIANASHNFNLSEDQLIIKEIVVEEGVTMHRWMPRARGAASPLRKRSSHVKVVLDKINNK